MEGGGTASPFIGRVPEIARLEDALAGASSGRPVVVVVGGEAGIGKTRLVEELCSRAHARGIRVMSGGCLALGGGGVPYAPFVEALRSLARELEPGRLPALLGPGRAELARLVPEMASRLIGASAGIASPAAAAAHGGPAPEAGLARIRLFEIVLGVAERLARDAPLLLVVEDLHHADVATRDLIRFLVRNLHDARACLVVTVRTDELAPGCPASVLIGELEARPGMVRLELGRFGRAEVAALLAGRLGETPGSALVDHVLVRSEGNPFYAELLADGLAASGRGDGASGREDGAGALPRDETPPTEMPHRLRDIIEARVASLPEPTREVLRVAALAGPRVDDRLLALAAGRPDRELFTALRDAVARRVLVSVQGPSGGAIAFSHSLIREAVAAQLFPAERAALHARYAEALLAHPEIGDGPTERAAALVHHWEGAGRPEQALPAAVSAGRAAEAVFAFADASRHYERALALWGRVPAGLRPLDVDRPGLLDRAADTAALTGEYERAIARWREALIAVDATVDPARAATYHDRLRWTLWQAGDGPAAAAEVDIALAMTPPQPPSQARARALAHKAGLLMLAGRSAESLPVAEESLAIGRAVDEPAEVSLALGIIAWDLVALGDDDQALALMSVAGPLADAYPRPEGAALAATNLVGILEKAGRFEEALAVAREAIERTRSIGLERTYGSALHANAASILIVLGGWDEADRLTADALDREPAGTEAILVRVTRGRLLVGRGRFAEAAPLLDAARAAAARANVADQVLRVATADTELALWSGRPDEALLVVDRALEPFAAPGTPPTADGSRPLDLAALGLCALGIRAAADEAERARAVRSAGVLDAAIQAGQRFLSVAENGATRSTGAWGPRLLLCRAEASRLGGPGDPEAWAAAAAAWDAPPRPYDVSYARLRQAEALVAARAPRLAVTEALLRALAPAEALRATPLLRAIDLLARRLRLDLAAPVAAPEAPARQLAMTPAGSSAGAATGLGLTTREREVLGLVAMGRTNREIAGVLFMSEKTASVHVSNILDKLGAVNRVEAAAIAVRFGLVADES